MSWECFQTLNELREAVWKQLDKFTPSQIKSIAGWNFIALASAESVAVSIDCDVPRRCSVQSPLFV
ncbi:MAG: hypothetical protein ACREPR_12570 [Brasilonema sp.]